MRTSLLSAFLIASLFVMGADVQDKDKKAPKNLVATHLFGRWTIDAAASEKLGTDVAKGETEIEFKEDAAMEKKILDGIPPKTLAAMKDMNLKFYASGTLVRGGKEFPFLLTDLAGSPYVFYFRERKGNPMGDSESFYVSIAVGAPAKDAAPNKDMLFVGGDFDNQPFHAFTRAK